MLHDLVVDSRHTIPAKDFSFEAVRASGPGGQNVNKVSSKIELRFDLPRSNALSLEVKERLAALAKNRLDAEGRVIMLSQKTRDQVRNLEDAFEKLAELIRAAIFVPKRRKKTRPTRGSVERRLDAKKKRSSTKEGRRVGND